MPRRRSARPIKDSLKIAQGLGGRGLREGHDPLQEPARAVLLAWAATPAGATTCCPATRSTQVGDEIPKPQGGGGGRGSQGSPDGEGQDEFTFTLTKEEFLDLFFDDLKLPNLIKVKLKDLKAPKPARAGFTTDGPPARLNHTRTMRKSLGRRMALRRPSEAEIERLEAGAGRRRGRDPRDDAKIAELRAQLEHKQRLRRTIAYIDPIDLQYNRFERVPKPTTQAVMFCLMDASASMTEPLKDLAKRFFMLLHVFLTRYYREVHIVFIRHTSTAAEVDEETFFRGTETGGTVISTALEEMLKVVQERYSPADWNIYAAQASDGDNFHDDMPRCLRAARRGDPADLPVLRLHRDDARRALQRRAGDAGLARLRRGRPARQELRHAPRGVARRTSSRSSTSCSRRDGMAA